MEKHSIDDQQDRNVAHLTMCHLTILFQILIIGKNIKQTRKYPKKISASYKAAAEYSEQEHCKTCPFQISLSGSCAQFGVQISLSIQWPKTAPSTNKVLYSDGHKHVSTDSDSCNEEGQLKTGGSVTAFSVPSSTYTGEMSHAKALAFLRGRNFSLRLSP